MNKLFTVIALCLLVSTNSYAKLKTIGSGDTLQVDPATIPPEFRKAYEIMTVGCASCHSQERTIFALQTGVSPTSHTTFDKEAIRAYGVKMMRKHDSGMTKQEIKATIDLLCYLLDQAQKK